MINRLRMPFLYSPTDGGGGGQEDWDTWFSDMGGEDPEPPNPVEPDSQAGLSLTDEQLDALADRMVQRMNPNPAATTGPNRAQRSDASDDSDGENEFLKQFADTVVNQTLGRLGPVLADSARNRVNGFTDLPQPVAERVNEALRSMPSSDLIQMIENGGIEVLVNATYGQMLREGKITPSGFQPLRSDSGDGVPSGASPEFREFVAMFRGMHGRNPTMDDAKRYGVAK